MSCFVVLKFGGTSVASGPRWRRIASILSSHLAQGRRPVLVCSAIAGVTDGLERLLAAVEHGEPTAPRLAELRRKHAELAGALAIDLESTLGDLLANLTAEVAGLEPGDPVTPAARAEIMAHGELMSTRLGAAWLSTQGLTATWVDARDLLTAAAPEPDCPPAQAILSARCLCAPDAALQARLAALPTQVVVTQGFIASGRDVQTVLLGRGGSDTSAAYVAALLEADDLEIWTDVPGMFTTDPRQLERARLLLRLTYDEAAVLGSLGARVLHPRCLEPTRATGARLAIRWTDRPDVEGTVIGRGEAFRTPGVKAVTSRKNLALLTMRRARSWQPVGFMADVARCFEDHGLSMDLISSSPSCIRVTVDLDAQPGARTRLVALCADLAEHCDPALTEDMASISLVGREVSTDLGRISEALAHFGQTDVELVSHAGDDSHISYVVDAERVDALVALIHDTVFAGVMPANHAFGPTWRALMTAPSPASAALDLLAELPALPAVGEEVPS